MTNIVVLSLIKSPSNWQPIDWADEPPTVDPIFTIGFDRPADAEQWRRTWNEAELTARNGFWAITRRATSAQRITRNNRIRATIDAELIGDRIRKSRRLRE